MPRLEPKKIPRVIYHYCSLDTFNAIITNKTLRLSDITKSNDSKELIFIKPKIEEIFMAAYKAESAKYFKNTVSEELWKEQITYYVSDWFDEKYTHFACYVMCFSGERDLLSQWRGYANDGKGVSIGFNSNALKQLIAGKEKVLSLNIVIYDKKTQRAKIRNIADNTIKAIKSKIVDERISDNALTEILNSAFTDLFDLAAICKNGFFREEGEYRICYRVDRTSVLNTNEGADFDLNKFSSFKPFKFLMKDNIISSYIDLCFEKAIKNNLHIIRDITTGPKCNVKSSEIRLLLLANGIDFHYQDGDIEIKESEGSYR